MIDKHIHLIVGGLHMVVAKDPDIERIVTVLRQDYQVDYVAPGHCTGKPMFAALRKAFGDHYLYAGLGSTIAFAQKPVPASGLAVPATGASGMDEEEANGYRALLSGSDDRADAVLASSER